MGVLERSGRTAGQMWEHGAAPLIGIKGGKGGWQVPSDPFGVTQTGLAIKGQPNPFMPGIGRAFREGGFAGAASRAKSWLGIGYQATGSHRKMPGMWRYLKTVSGLPNIRQEAGGPLIARTRAESIQFARSLRSEAQQAGRVFRTRQIGAGIAGVAGLAAVSNTVGFGNAMTLGAGAAGGAVLGGALGHAMTTRRFAGLGGTAIESMAGRSAMSGRRWGGGIGAGVAGLGLLTGIL